MNKTAVIVCNGSIYDYEHLKKYFTGAEFIICADGGALHIKRFGIRPDVILGDFDSICPEDLAYFKEQKVDIFKYPVQKDMTDTEIAVDLAIDKGYRSIIIIGGTGTRLDHSMANVFLLKKMLDRGIRGTVVNEHNEITITNSRVTISREENFKVTLLPLTEKVEGVTTKGLFYKLDNAEIVMGSSFGVSNEFTEDIAVVTISEGLLLVIKSRD